MCVRALEHRKERAMQEAKIVTMVTQAQPPLCESFDGFKLQRLKANEGQIFSVYLSAT